MQICKYANSQYGMRRCRVRYRGNSFYFRISYFHACILSHLHITLAYSKVFSHAVTDYGSLLLDWHNALVGRNTGNPTNMQLELFGDGSFEWRTDDSSHLYAPVFPFDWDGDGLENSVDPEPLVAGPDAPLDRGMPFAKIYRDLNLTNRRPLPYRSSDMLLQDQPMT